MIFYYSSRFSLFVSRRILRNTRHILEVQSFLFFNTFRYLNRRDKKIKTSNDKEEKTHQRTWWRVNNWRVRQRPYTSASKNGVKTRIRAASTKITSGIRVCPNYHLLLKCGLVWTGSTRLLASAYGKFPNIVHSFDVFGSFSLEFRLVTVKHSYRTNQSFFLVL